MDHRAGKNLRVTRRGDIQRVFDRGRRAWDGTLTLCAVPREESGAPSRLGVAVSFRHGKAVRRNRVKRLCREAFRLLRGELPGGYDYIMIPRAGRELTLDALQRALRALAPRVAGDAPSEPPP